MEKGNHRIYLDNNATVPLRPEVRENITRYLETTPGNPSSIHAEGRVAKAILSRARRSVAALIGADEEEIVFTSGGTESNNLAIKGTCSPSVPCHIITTEVEHPSVLAVVEGLEKKGATLTKISVDRCCSLKLGDLETSLTPQTSLVSVIWANNETGVISPMTEVARLVKNKSDSILLHADGVQLIGKGEVDVKKVPIDLLSISGHKIGALPGVGALYVRSGVKLEPLIQGSSQERRRRAGTESLFLLSAFGEAASVVKNKLAEESARMQAMRDFLENEILRNLTGIHIRGGEEGQLRLSNTSSITVEGVEGDTLLVTLDLEGIAVSLGPACSSGSSSPSHVLLAMGLSYELASSTVRVSLGWHNTDKDIQRFVEIFVRTVMRLREADAHATA